MNATCKLAATEDYRCIKLCLGDLSNGVVGETMNEPYKNKADKGSVGG